MTAAELIGIQIDDAGYQIEQALAGLTGDQQGMRLEGAMSPIEVLDHLSECYVAAVTEIAGEKYQWGSTKPIVGSWEERLANWRALRAKAREAAVTGDDHALKEGNSYIVGHDYYHVGPLCHLRLHLDPEWNYMSIYSH